VLTALVVLQAIQPSEAPVLERLLQLYAHDFSEHVALELRADGSFALPPLEKWWHGADHFPFFIRADEKLCGFALVRQGSRAGGASEVMDVAEFFVVRGARGKGIGRAAAHELFRHFTGPWEIRVRQSNTAALHFWSRTLQAWSGSAVAPRAFAVDGVDWYVLSVAGTRSAIAR